VTAGGSSYRWFRFPPEVISHCVWLYHRFPLSFRDVRELMLERGVDVCYETIRAWCERFGQRYANRPRRRGRRLGDNWHLDEVFVEINGAQRYLWRAVDRHGNVLDILVQSRRNAVAAKKFFRRLLKGLRYLPRVIVTDKLASYPVAHRELMPSVRHRRSTCLNNRAENSQQPTRHRERAMKRFTSIRHAQRLLSAFSGIWPHFRPRRHPLSGGRLPTGDGRPLRGLERNHRGDDHGRRLNRRLGQDVSSKPMAHHPESSHRPIRLTQVDSAGSCPPSVASSPHTCGRDGICSPRPNGEPRWPTASRSGVRSPRPTLPPEM
jgi:putative transposase